MKKMNFKSENETKLVCPNCGTEFKIAENTHLATGMVIGKDSNLGTIHPEIEKNGLPKKATERIEALREAGIDVSNLFAMTGSNGGEYVVSQKDGKISVLDDEDPIFKSIISQGTVPNRRLFRRFIMSKLLKMLHKEISCNGFRANSITSQIRKLGYNYMWEQLLDELNAQAMMWKNGDKENFEDRNRWFNKELVVAMIKDYHKQLRLHIDYKVKVQKCKGVPYKRICGEDIFVSDIQKKVYAPISSLVLDIQKCDNPSKLFRLVWKFNKIRKIRKWEFIQSSLWLDAYKGAGAFFTMQNMIRFHGCRLKLEDSNVFLEKECSYNYLKTKAKEYENEGWRMIGLLRKFLQDNNVDIVKKMSEWRKK